VMKGEEVIDPLHRLTRLQVSPFPLHHQRSQALHHVSIDGCELIGCIARPKVTALAPKDGIQVSNHHTDVLHPKLILARHAPTPCCRTVFKVTRCWWLKSSVKRHQELAPVVVGVGLSGQDALRPLGRAHERSLIVLHSRRR
jgi:hypothetical protein